MKRTRRVVETGIRGVVAAAIVAISAVGASAAERAPELEEVVVTAQRRAQNLQDVPVAVTAITAEALQERGAVDFGTYLRTVPGASVAELGTQGNEVKFRGIGNGTAQLSPTTAVYLGEVPIMHSAPSINSSYNFRLVDMARVEVLRGPQGQLYGANSLGAAIKNVPNSPDLQTVQFGGSVGGYRTQGGGGSYAADATINLPLARDVLAARLTGYYAKDGGWYDNVFAGGVRLSQLVPPGAPVPLTGPYARIPYAALGQAIAANPALGSYATPSNAHRDVNSSTVEGARGMLRWTPGGNFSGELMLAWEKKHTDGTSWATEIANVPATSPLYPAYPPAGVFVPFFGPPRVWVPNTAGGTPSFTYLYPTNSSRYEQANASDAKAADKIFLANLVLDWDLGFASLRTSLSHWNRTEALDTDLSVFGFLNTGVFGGAPAIVHRDDNPKNTIEEVRLTSQGQGRLHWIAGLYHEDVTQGYTATSQDLTGLNLFYQLALAKSRSNLGPAPASTLWGLQDVHLDDEQYAAYGELAFDLTPTFTAAISARGFKLKQSALIVNSGFQYQGQPNTDRKHEDSVLTPKVNLSWKPGENQLYYLTASQGYRTGITNNDVPLNLCTQELAVAGTPSGLQPTKPDKLWNYELGTKFTLADRRVTINGAIYHVDWSNLQSQAVLSALAANPQASQCNFVAIFNVGKAHIDGAELELAAQLTPRVRLNWSFAATDPRYGNDFAALGIVKDARIQGTPRSQSSLGLQYNFGGDRLPGFARIDWTYTGEIANAGNDFRTQAAPYQSGDFHTVALRFGATIAKNLRFELFGDNLLNTFGVTRQIDVAGGAAPTVFTIRPRTVGANLRLMY